MSAEPASAYRPDIDGLRAVAVMAVLLYHAGIPGFSGGFVGVDVFFVISGYLVTGIVAREVASGTFTLKRFYERRARRILPALLAVSAAVLALATGLFLPGDLAAVGPSVLATLGFSANLWFFTQTGYFQADAETMPMLHAWSLGVEEQFYLLLPLLLLALHRFGARWQMQAIMLVALGSLAWALAKQGDTDGFAFYMLPTRAWELLAGSIVALAALPQPKQVRVRELLCWAALAAIGWAVATYDKTTPFPGLSAIPPVLAAAILLAYAPGTRLAALLSLRGPVFIGLISYSLYLWHWPIIVFWRYAQDAALTGWQPAGAITASLAIAWLSWKFIEQPFRSPAGIAPRRALAVGGVVTATVAAASLALVSTGGWPGRFDQRSVRFAAAAGDVSPVREACITGQATTADPRCVLGAAVAPSAVLWGDSHGVELAWALGEVLGNQGRATIQRTHPSCPPTLGYDDARDPLCARFNADVIEQIERTPGITTVYLAAFWAKDTYRDAGVDRQLDTTLARLQQAGKQVVLIGPVPPQPSSVPRRLALRGPAAETATRAEFHRQTHWFTRHFARWRQAGVTVVEPADRLFAGDRSIIVAGDSPLYFDSHHLSLSGARYVLAGPDGIGANDHDGNTDRHYRQRRADGAGAATGRIRGAP